VKIRFDKELKFNRGRSYNPSALDLVPLDIRIIVPLILLGMQSKKEDDVNKMKKIDQLQVAELKAAYAYANPADPKARVTFRKLLMLLNGRSREMI